MLKTIPLILTAVLLNACAQLALKAGMIRVGPLDLSVEKPLALAAHILLNRWVMAGLSCYVFSVGLWLISLSRVQVSFAYPFLSVGYVVTALAAYVYLGENLSTMRVSGIGLICLGVILVAQS
jgi:multidrug transporter EmrE-like cation transporter